MLVAKIRDLTFMLVDKRRAAGRAKYWRNIFRHNICNRILTADQKQIIQAFYKPFIPKGVDDLYHDFYTQKTGKFFAEYIPDDLYYCYIDTFYNDWNAAKHLDNKCYYRLLMSDVPQPKIVVCRINGFWYEEVGNDLRSIAGEQAYALIAKQACFIKQASESEGGVGVRYIEQCSTAEIIGKTIETLKDDLIVQAVLEQSKTMAALNPSSVNTVRVLSLLKRDGSVKIYSTIVRMGIHGAKVDNASSGGITCGVDTKGRLKSVAYSASGVRYDSHPDTGLHFETCVIPSYDQIRETVVKIHPRFSHFRLISWDFAIDDNDNPNLIEVNLRYGELDFHQLNNGPLFGEDTEEILREVFFTKNNNLKY